MRTDSQTILAIDTSTHAIGIALLNHEQILCEHTWQSADYHTVELAPMVQQALLRSQISSENLSAIAVALGPGSFTGLRIGLALAKGLALAAHIPLIGIPTLDILANSQPPQETHMLCLLRTGRGRLAIRAYQRYHQEWQAQDNYEVLTLAEILQKIDQPTWVCGEISTEERAQLRSHPMIKLASPAQCVRRPAVLAELAFQRLQKKKFDDPISLTPIYLHYNEPISVAK
ncbi:MAG: tRNA (adenosine(37)-N6)-threonylcarbamoyltransferase complex dimerization subunit type 1 TsaB [Anaerolineales bacterium]